MPRADGKGSSFRWNFSSVDFLPMILRNRFLITALFLCHQLLAQGLVTRRLLADSEPVPAPSVQSSVNSPFEEKKSTPCATEAATQGADSARFARSHRKKTGI